MRLLLPIALAAVLVAVVALAMRGSDADGYRVDAIFDSAEGMVPGQLVKIAGARVGKVTDVTLAPGRKARVSMRVPERYGPFHSDARCQILPEGVISEKYVDCDPGSTRGELARGGSGRPTVPVARTAIPVSVQDLFNIFSVPTSQRLRLVIGELGIATAGRGGDINDVLRRANPALREAHDALATVRRHTTALTAAVGQTDTILAALADRRRDVRGFVGRSAATARTTAERRGALGAGVRRLPAMLRTLRASLPALDRFADDATPLLAQLRAGAPQLTRLTTTLPAFAKAGVPAVDALGVAAKRTRAALPSIDPVAARLSDLTRQAKPSVGKANGLLESFRDRGGNEYLLRLLYRLSTVSSSYDAVSHMLGLYVFAEPDCIVAPRTRGCSHAYEAPGHGRIPVNERTEGEPPSTSRSRASFESLLESLFG